jgi:hypothetical protein
VAIRETHRVVAVTCRIASNAVQHDEQRATGIVRRLVGVDLDRFTGDLDSDLAFTCRHRERVSAARRENRCCHEYA